jgi:hypothetical protein
MSGAEFMEHWEDYQHAPWGPMRDLIHAAMQTQAIANYAGKSLKEGVRVELDQSVMDLRYQLEKMLHPDKFVDNDPDPAAYFNHVNK